MAFYALVGVQGTLAHAWKSTIGKVLAFAVAARSRFVSNAAQDRPHALPGFLILAWKSRRQTSHLAGRVLCLLGISCRPSCNLLYAFLAAFIVSEQALRVNGMSSRVVWVVPPGFALCDMRNEGEDLRAVVPGR